MVKTKTWRKQHKWIGLVISFFLVMFCLSGIVLNHRQAVQGWNVNRLFLPPFYHFKNWDKGLLRGTVRCNLDGRHSVLLYGSGGCWLTDSTASGFSDFNTGLPEGQDQRSLRSVVVLPGNQIIAAGQYCCYRLSPGTPWHWIPLPLPLENNERISDMTARGDTLLVAGRSFLYMAVPPYKRFQRIDVKASAGYDGKVSLFRTVWQLHSGELFGLAGRLLLDIVAICLMVLCVTAWLYWFLPRRQSAVRRYALLLHDRLGTRTIVFTLLIAFTGWCLRPPVLIALVQTRVPALPGTSLDSSNPWHDNLRMIRYDARTGEWLLSTSDGFYALRSLYDVPRKLSVTPPVSVMGLNVWQQEPGGDWLAGSFSGMYRWNRHSGRITDYATGRSVSLKPGPPFGKEPVAGFTSDLKGKSWVINYEKGSDFAAMPSSFSTLPMSLWEVALEIHSGRIYIYNNLVSMVFICLAGIFVIWTLWSGYRIRIRKHKRLKHH